MLKSTRIWLFILARFRLKYSYSDNMLSVFWSSFQILWINTMISWHENIFGITRPIWLWNSLTIGGLLLLKGTNVEMWCLLYCSPEHGAKWIVDSPVIWHAKYSCDITILLSVKRMSFQQKYIINGWNIFHDLMNIYAGQWQQLSSEKSNWVAFQYQEGFSMYILL